MIRHGSGFVDVVLESGDEYTVLEDMKECD